MSDLVEAWPELKRQGANNWSGTKLWAAIRKWGDRAAAELKQLEQQRDGAVKRLWEIKRDRDTLREAIQQYVYQHTMFGKCVQCGKPESDCLKDFDPECGCSTGCDIAPLRRALVAEEGEK